MNYWASFLIALALTGVISAVANLFLPRHLSGVGRLIKVICATVTLLILVSPLLSLLSDAQIALEHMADQFAPKASLSPENTEPLESFVVTAAAESLKEEINARMAYEFPDQAICIEVEYLNADEGINPAGIVIYSNDEKFDAARATRIVEEEFGLTARVVSGESKK